MTGAPGRPAQAPSPRDRLLAMYNAGAYAQVVQLAPQVLQRRPRDADLLIAYGVSLVRVHKAPEALLPLRKAVAARPDDPRTHCNLANALRALGRLDDAHAAIDRGVEADPTSVMARRAKAMVLHIMGRSNEAMAALQEAITPDAPDPAMVLAFGWLCRDTGRHADALDEMRRLLDKPDLQPALRRDALNCLGHLLDKCGHYDEAFAAFQEGQSMLPAGPPLDHAGLIDAWSAERIRELGCSSITSELPILIVGMPRSGTSLTEQVIASHPAADGVGESPLLPTLGRVDPRQLQHPHLDRIGSQYIAMLQQVTGPDTRRVADKMPGNYVFLGLAACALPKARVVHCQRDARDTCLSCFFQEFGTTHTYTRDLVACAKQYLAYREVMRHWANTIDLPIIESRYEDLTAEPGACIPELLDFLGLDDHPACHSFHENPRAVLTASLAQVRKPIYRSSTERWKRYEAHLGPMLELLDGV